MKKGSSSDTPPDPRVDLGAMSTKLDRPALRKDNVAGAVDDDLDARDFEAIKPASGLIHKQMRARLKEKLFGAPQQPVRLGRFVILERLGEGGMGVVYSAYDPDLDRRVALKLLRTTGYGGRQNAKERLLREAQALARLSHPNVVPIYDVGLIDEQVFIVMEFVVGHTLRAWVEEKKRRWNEVLAMYRQAGQGLAAAHAQGLIHRDFKPDNVQVGDDGRVRVLDFGLARGRYPENSDGSRPVSLFDSGERVSPFVETMPPSDNGSGESGVSGEPGDDSSPGPSNRRLNTPLTATGALVGTPAYMSPEQFADAKVGAHSDQFSFCVSLYEGLYGQRPFAGDTVGELRRNIKAGRVRPPPRNSGVPGWIYPILCRGLAPEPADRYPSMDRLLSELGRDPARYRRRVLLAVLVLALAGTSVYSIVQARSDAPDVCAGADSELAGVWDQGRSAAVKHALLATGQPYAMRAWPRVNKGLDTYAKSWVGMREAACRAHQRGEQSGELLDRRMLCMDRRLSSLDSAVSVLAETNADSLENAVDVVQKLPSIAYCGNAEALGAEVPPPEDPDIAARVEALRGRLDRAKALEDAGRYSEALAVAVAVVSEARELDYRPLMAQAYLVEGRITMTMGTGEEAVEPLHQATVLGLSAGMNDVGLEAMARRIYAEGTSSRSRRDVLDSLYIARALLDRVPDSAFVRALLLNNAGAVYMARKQREKAREYFEQAEAVREHGSISGAGRIELTIVPLNLALVTRDAARRTALMASALDEIERELGSDHPRALARRLMAAGYILDPGEARRSIDKTCTSLERYHPDLHARLANCLYSLGLLDAEFGDQARASERLMRAAEVSRQSGDEQSRWFVGLAHGYGLLHGGDARAALVALGEARAALPVDPDHWWEKKRVAEVLLAMGLGQLDSMQYRQARSTLEQARVLFVQSVELNHKVETQRRLARTQVALAHALWNGPGRRDDKARARAMEMLGSAEEWYRNAGPGYAQRLQELLAWQKERGVSDE